MKVLQMNARSDEKKAFPKAVIFDLDGTLIDTAPDLAKALNHCLVADGLDPFTTAQMRGLIGHGASALLARGYLLREGAELKADRLARLLQKFLTFYRVHLADDSHPFEGVEEALSALKAKGTALGICTNKPHDMAITLLNHFGWTERFHSIIGGDMLEVKKPNPHHILAVADALNTNARDCVFVGDSEVDYEAGRNAAMRTIIVRFGYRNMPLEEMTGTVILDHYDTFMNAVASF